MARVGGKQFAKAHGIDVKHALYRKSGDWYHILKEFPAALFDENGHINFKKSSDYDSFVSQGKELGINQNIATNTLTIRDGISSHKSYIPFAAPSPFPDEIISASGVIEGAKRQITVNAYERDSSARKSCIRKWGIDCAVCGLNFEKVYGKIGEGFIHAHHLTPISSIKQEYLLDPERDMRPVCPNCHAMLHRQEPPLSIKELRDVLSERADR